MKLMVSAAALAALCLAPGAARAADDEAAQYQALVQKVAPLVVTVKAILKTQFKGGGASQDQESHVTTQGVIVDPDGLIAVSSVLFSPAKMMEMFGGEEGGPDMGVKVTPSSFKVIFGSEEKEYDAFQAASDNKTGLVFLKVDGLGGRKLPSVDFSSPATPAVGQRIAAVSRLGKGYDYAPFFQTARVSGEISKPQKAWTVDGGMPGFGLPVYLPTGEMVGLLSVVGSGLKDEATRDEMGMQMFMRMFAGGGGGSTAFILPAQPLKAVVDQAKAQAVTVAAERARQKQAAPAATTPKPPAPKKP